MTLPERRRRPTPVQGERGMSPVLAGGSFLAGNETEILAF